MSDVSTAYLLSYFLQTKTGQLEIMLDTVNVVSHLQKGDMFGQIALTTDGCHDFNVRAAVYSEVLSLNREAYDDLSAESEKFMELVEMEAIKQEQFIVKAQKNIKHFANIGRANSSKKFSAKDLVDGRTSLAASAQRVASASGVVEMFRRASIRTPKITPTVSKPKELDGDSDDDDDDDDDDEV